MIDRWAVTDPQPLHPQTYTYIHGSARISDTPSQPHSHGRSHHSIHLVSQHSLDPPGHPSSQHPINHFLIEGLIFLLTHPPNTQPPPHFPSHPPSQHTTSVLIFLLTHPPNTQPQSSFSFSHPLPLHNFSPRFPSHLPSQHTTSVRTMRRRIPIKTLTALTGD